MLPLSTHLFSHLLIPLKVLTNEKRGGLKVVEFDRSPFILFTLRFSNKSVQAASCERLRTAPRTLFLLFEINNCFQITVQRRNFMKKSGKLAFHVVNSNIAIGSVPRLLNYRQELQRYLKRFLIVTQPLFQLSVLCEKCVAARRYAII